MDQNTAAGVRPALADPDFGTCPKCCGNDGYLNVGREHWGVCHAHGMKWRIGENLFSSWRDETPRTWERNARTLAGYVEA